MYIPLRGFFPEKINNLWKKAEKSTFALRIRKSLFIVHPKPSVLIKC